MPARQVREILDAVRQVHQQIASRIRELEAVTTDDRIQILLKDMENREVQFETCVAEFEAEGHRESLNVWLQFVPEEILHLDRIADRLSVPHALCNLVEEAIRLNSSLVDAYLALSRNAEMPAVQELFGNLAELEEQNDLHYAKTLLE